MLESFAQNKSGDVGMQNRCLGNVDELEEADPYPPGLRDQCQRSVELLECAPLAYPIFYNREAKLVHRYVIQDNISDLLRVRARDTPTSPWQYVKGFLPKYMTGPVDGKLPAPDVGLLCTNSDEDRDVILYDLKQNSDGSH